MLYYSANFWLMTDLPVAICPEINNLMFVNPLFKLKSYLNFSIFASIPYSDYQSKCFSFNSSPSAWSSTFSCSKCIISLGLKNLSMSNYCYFGFCNNVSAGTMVTFPLPTFLLMDLMILYALLLSLSILSLSPFPLIANMVLSTAIMYCLAGLIVITFLTNLATSMTWTVGIWFNPSFITCSSAGCCNHACLNHSKSRSSPLPYVTPHAII